jgi:hypothetical protein
MQTSVYGVAVRWFLYGAIVGILVGLWNMWEANALQHWQTAAGSLLTTTIEFGVVGVLIGVFRHHLANR